MLLWPYVADEKIVEILNEMTNRAVNPNVREATTATSFPLFIVSAFLTLSVLLF